MGADKTYDIAPFVDGRHEIDVKPHVAKNTTHRASAFDERTNRHPGYVVSQVICKLIETNFEDVKEH